MRTRVGWLVALAYLFCVLAPAAALAWGNAAAPCLGDDGLLADLVMVHQAMPAGHVHSEAAHDHANTHAYHQTAAQDAPAEHHRDGKGAPGPCCAMMCVSALPVALPDLAKPIQPISACAPEITASLHSEAPPLLYRPPIA
ncbi:hypothetical protein QA641_35260 [Bradyrhizobium sp. CB1650]|uniref:hypothetical protein n=1 Tax=Bradyrhizobium sp. CB1650 TaxID=3039153 RepID=UPI0024351643|nr:hypothetical protein [Bradyrhizobium sp. CB1650]WGD50803.1 hypothetical protein QA641_35260 [Bradyrhizobium sp. CB1650]